MAKVLSKTKLYLGQGIAPGVSPGADTFDRIGNLLGNSRRTETGAGFPSGFGQAVSGVVTTVFTPRPAPGGTLDPC